MPDIYTPRPDIVSRFLKEAGFTHPVQPTILKDRPADITYRFDTPGTYVEFYVHDLRELPQPERPALDLPSLALGLALGVGLGALGLRLRRF